jgi:hypothetical protein
MGYFLLRHNQESGPFSLEQLQEMSLHPNDQIRMGSFGAWTSAKEIDTLKAHINYSDRLAAFDSEIKKGYDPSATNYIDPRMLKAPKANRVAPAVLLVAILAVVSGTAFWLLNKKPGVKEEAIAIQAPANVPEIIIPSGAADSIKEDIRLAIAKRRADSIWREKRKPTNIKKLLYVQANDYRVKILGGINNLKLTVENKSEVYLENVSIQVDYLKRNDEIVHTETISTEQIRPQEIKIIEVPSNSRGVKITYKILTVTPSEAVASL